MKEIPMNKSMQSLAAALAFTLLAPSAWAGQDDHAGHQKAPASEAGKMDHGQMDHSQMQGMDPSQMQNMDHSKMDHGAMHKDAKPKAESNDDR
jgi:copper resistance protein B